MTKRFAATLGLLALSALPARAILVDNSWNLTASNTLATNFGSFPAFRAAGSISITEGTNNFGATGVLIASDWVLTAAHNWTTNAVTAMTFTVGGTTYNANLAQLHQHPNWITAPSPLANASAGASQGWDIALFKLTTAVSGITPAGLYTGNSELGAQVYTLGFGRTGTGTTTSVENASGNVHAISNTIDRTTSQTANGRTGGQLFYDFDSGLAAANTLVNAGLPGSSDPFLTTLNPTGTISGTTSTLTQVTSGGSVIEGGTAQGDSGGPTYIHNGTTWVVAGLTSWGINPINNTYATTGLYGDVTALTRVSEHIAWINSITAIPEPSTYAAILGALALVVTAVRRRRQKA